MFKIANTDIDLHNVQELIKEYFVQYGQFFPKKYLGKILNEIPNKDLKSNSFYILAKAGKDPAGCIRLKKLGNHTCEIGRFYVKPEFRGHKIGLSLLKTIVNEAKSLGCTKIFLDTIPEFASAVALYKSFGFVETAPYYESQLRDPIYMEMNI